MNSRNYTNNISAPPAQTPGLHQRPTQNGNAAKIEVAGDAQRSFAAPHHQSRSSVFAPLAIVALLLVGFFLNSFRSMEAIDLKSDESTYAIESVALAHTGMTRWNGGPFLIHPPLFFLVEGVYFQLLGIGEGPLFTRLIGEHYTAGEALLPASVELTGDSMTYAIEMARYLNAFYGAVMAALIFLLGRTLLNNRLGLLGAVLFIIDPYVVWRNHFNYLEGLATIFGVLAIFLYYKATARSDRGARLRGYAAAGLFLGLALLTKELALLFVVAIAANWLIFSRKRAVETALPLGIGLALYLLFPAWAALNGEFQNWWDARNWLVRRLTGQIRDSGVATDKPGTSFLDTLAVNIPDYWPWFLILGLAFLLAVWFIYLYTRHGLRDRAGEFLAASVVSTYAFFVVVRLVGGVINEHFFYYLMPFACLMPAYVALRWPFLESFMRQHRADRADRADRANRAEGIQKHEAGLETRASRFGVAQALLGALLVLALYNAGAWVARYGFSRDNSYITVEGALANTLPAGSLVVGRDLLDLYLLPKQGVFTFSYLNLIGKLIDPANIRERRIPYALLNEQSLQQRYGGANPVYYSWVQQNGKELSQFDGRLYDTFVYGMDYSRPEQGFNDDSLSVGRPVTVSSSENLATFAPENAVDARITTRWASKESDNEWIYVDLGETRNISRVILSWEEAFAVSYQLQTSDDAQNWRTFYNTMSGTGSLETIEAPASGRYVRLLMTQRGTKYGYSLWEISIYP
ncbi:MAG: discoidin domain-containing protein [Chloroflexia bacterium]